MKKWIAAVSNFFFPGLGNMIFNYKRLLGIGWFLGVLGLTYVEFGIQKPMPTLYWIMFGSVFLMNTMFAIDAFQGVKELEEGHAS